MKTLVVEDESICRQLLMELMAGYGITHGATDGTEALTKFQEALLGKEHYDLICLDIMMPELDGQETLRKIREIETSQGIPATKKVNIIMVTALQDNNNIVEAYENEACQAYLSKPITPNTLHGSLQELGLLTPGNVPPF